MVDIGECITWTRDLTIIIFAIAMTIIGLSTYKLARVTIFSPIRKATAKKQVDILSELLTFLKDHRNSTERLYDYANLVSLNIELILNEIGLKKISTEEKEKIDSRFAGWLPFYGQNKKDIIYLTGNLESFSNSIQPIDQQVIQKNTLDLIAKKNDSGLPVLFFTKHYYESALRIEQFMEDPFIPPVIYGHLFKLKTYGKGILMDNVERGVIEYIIRYSDLMKANTLNSENIKLIDALKEDSFRPGLGDPVDELTTEVKKYLELE
jgi:hypothetical protein